MSTQNNVLLQIIFLSLGSRPLMFMIYICLAPVVRKVDNAIHRINRYPVNSVVCVVNTYPLDSDLSGG